MIVTYHSKENMGGLRVTDPVGDLFSASLPYEVYAEYDSRGVVYALDTMDARHWGDPFDEAAARRCLEWAQARVDERAAAS